jgi:membrane-associated phospholipid phosphatase
MLLALRTRSKGLIFTILPFYILMCLSTVYIYAHYAIDAIAGLITGIAIYHALCGIYKKMGHH